MTGYVDDSDSDMSAISDDEDSDDDGDSKTREAEAFLFRKAFTNASVTSLNTKKSKKATKTATKTSVETDTSSFNPSPTKKPKTTVIEYDKNAFDLETVTSNLSRIDQVEGDMSTIKKMMTALLTQQKIDLSQFEPKSTITLEDDTSSPPNQDREPDFDGAKTSEPPADSGGSL